MDCIIESFLLIPGIFFYYVRGRVTLQQSYEKHVLCSMVAWGDIVFELGHLIVTISDKRWDIVSFGQLGGEGMGRGHRPNKLYGRTFYNMNIYPRSFLLL
jgi:hypothetical protein